jgi:hypothetical protein
MCLSLYQLNLIFGKNIVNIIILKTEYRYMLDDALIL